MSDEAVAPEANKEENVVAEKAETPKPAAEQPTKVGASGKLFHTQNQTISLQTVSHVGPVQKDSSGQSYFHVTLVSGVKVAVRELACSRDDFVSLLDTALA